jgi:pimeloyl-ACP methyl ester carboxylesterase
VNVKRALVGAGLVAVGVAGALYGAERAVLRRIRGRPDPDAGESFELPPGAAVRFPSHDGGTIAIRSVGSGPPIVLSHGVTLTNQAWVKQFESLPREGFRVVAFDQRGHGESELGTTGHSVDNLADDVRSVLQALDLRDVVLVGHSMGGVGVQAYAIRHRDHAAARVRGLVLMSTLAKVRTSRLRWFAGLGEQIAARGPDVGTLLQRRDIGLLLARIGFGVDPRPSHVELTRRMIAACAPETARAAPSALFRLDLTPALPTIELPTLVVCGTADLITPPAESRRIAELIPEARLELLPQAGHMPMLERASEVDALIAGFAREVGARAPLAG